MTKWKPSTLTWDLAVPPPQIPQAVLNTCFVCGGDHAYHQCPKMQPPAPPSPTDPPPESSGSSLLARDKDFLETTYGPEWMAALYNNIDNMALSPEQRALMLELVYGFRRKDELEPGELDMLQEAAIAFSTGRSRGNGTQPAPKPSAPLRPSWHHSEAEMTEDPVDVFTRLHMAKEEPPAGGSSPGR